MRSAGLWLMWLWCLFGAHAAWMGFAMGFAMLVLKKSSSRVLHYLSSLAYMPLTIQSTIRRCSRVA